MKIAYFALTILLQFILIVSLKLLDNLPLIGGIFAICLTIGFFLMYIADTINPTLKNFGWGLRYGSLFSAIATFLFLWWLANNFPH